ncbi:hypothetical protein TAMA11512_01510 [Selenomonas sp. TAMA-11512]|uniref:ECF transporter S component n=1 Tax=Selenomonas sp. TAMA-11512 TaxID=3095337 RepID=UPI00309288C1|nr:hypothetical protein TAMA11512_01510 [Selenomonas sp. TAMA-11512]
MKQPYTTKTLTRMGMMAAITLLLTLIPKIPIPLGYAHLGNVAVLLFSLRYAPGEAGAAVAAGSALADFFGGFPLWILPTLIIKYVMAVLVWNIAGGTDSRLRAVAGFLAASLWMALGYTLCGAILYDSLAAGLASTPGLLMEGGLSIAAAVLALVIIKRRSRHSA